MGLFDKIKKSLFGHKDEEQEENREKELTEKSNEETQESEEPSEAENVEKIQKRYPIQKLKINLTKKIPNQKKRLVGVTLVVHLKKRKMRLKNQLKK